MNRRTLIGILLMILVVVVQGCGQPESQEELTIYSGRGSNLVDPLLEDIEEDLDVTVDVRYGETSQLAATILEEGQQSPADLFYAQDAGALGALQREDRLRTLPDELLEQVDPAFRSPEGRWIGISGRARVLNYNVNRVEEDELPEDLWELTESRWEGEVGWAPENGSFQSFITAMRTVHGEERTREWIEAMMDNGVRSYSANTPIVDALGRGEISIGLVNNYYLHRFRADDPDFPVRAHFLSDSVGSLINVAGVGVLDSASNPELAHEVIREMLTEERQRYFAEETFEYPLAGDVDPVADQPPLSAIDQPEIDLSDLEDLEGTLELLRETGAL